VERVVTSQLHQYLAANDLLPRFQSAYGKYHSTETAMQRVWFDILVAADDRKVMLLGLPDLSAGFDCVDHSMLLERLQSAFGLTDLVLDWGRSFLADRTQQIAYSGHLSSVQSVLFGVPQGYVLSPLLYVLYTAELALVVDHHDLSLTNMLMTRRFTSTHRLVTLRLPSEICVCHLHRGMVEGQLISTERHQDPGNVVGFSTAAGESQRFRGSSGVDTYQCLGDST